MKKEKNNVEPICTAFLSVQLSRFPWYSFLSLLQLFYHANSTTFTMHEPAERWTDDLIIANAEGCCRTQAKYQRPLKYQIFIFSKWLLAFSIINNSLDTTFDKAFFHILQEILLVFERIYNLNIIYGTQQQFVNQSQNSLNLELNHLPTLTGSTVPTTQLPTV